MNACAYICTRLLITIVQASQPNRSARERGREREREYDVKKKAGQEEGSARKGKEEENKPFLNVAEHSGRQRVSEAYCACCYQFAAERETE